MLPDRKALPALQDLCGLAPMQMRPGDFKALSATTHSPHGTPADLVRFMGAARGFGGNDGRVAGHWLRDRHAAGDLPVRPGGGARPSGAPNARADMERRYTQGDGRCGERREQISLRYRLVRAVAASLRASPVPWLELPRDLSSWDALLAPQPDDAQPLPSW